MNIQRVRQLHSTHSVPSEGSCVMYWMSRDQRVHDNWALVYAQQLAQQHHVPLVVVFALANGFPHANLRHYDFMLRGLSEVQHTLHQKQIPFHILHHSDKKVPELVLHFIQKSKPFAVVTDFSPLRIGRLWREYVSKHIDIPLYEVDAHNVVPAWVISDHQEFAAHTLRPKLYKKIDEYLDDYPEIKAQHSTVELPALFDIDSILNALPIDRDVPPVDWIKPGEHAASNMLDIFMDEKLGGYKTLRNDPTQEMQSNLSPYLHYGHISAQRIVIEVMAKSKKRLRAKLTEAEHSAEAFLEELVVRKELADNFCLYNEHYDSFDGAPDWAKKTLLSHVDDVREPVYTLRQLEQAHTYDELWNASQRELLVKGKIHGYMRMYWAKKILEWSPSPQKAVENAVYLNDKYHLDGRDPNGYVGILWSIAGLHDRPWFDRPIFGQIRYMSENGLRQKFDIDSYIRIFS